MTRTKVLLDTDIGTDIDDAVCLAYLLANPACDLVGITTVTGEARKRAQMASAMCRVAGRDVPIFPGVERPLLVAQRQRHAAQAAALGKWPHATAFPSGEAVHFMSETIRRHPREIVLLTIGPLTNAGLLFATDPKAASLLKGLVMMCGVFTNRLGGVGAREWNAMGDPHATAIVYRQKARVHRSVGLDVTRQVTLSADEVRRRFTAPLLRPVRDFAEVWFKGMDRITFHDPLAAAVVFQPDLCRFERGTVDVELASERLAGLTHWQPGGTRSPHEVAVAVDAERFFEHFFGVIDAAV